MKQRLLEELEGLRDAHRRATTQDAFDALELRLRTVEALSASASHRSKSERQSLARVKALVLEAARAHRDGAKQPANFSGAVFTLMQAVRRGTSGYDV
ncbi:hypothetical protein [Rubellimicrobium aerolatum]|uniref:Uncharacterized protein n=1 Tax=Rubellimicrobium aerolatum TaxID=490979 RepID=A0ABW0SAE0_9RHOB|nr:hypothetical protein [Rubellimicrobium aerolatum]MBP1805241.1 hypothetical protein [Rubellimicrobium aerolatum]